MQSLLPHLPMMEASPSPPPPAPEPIPQRNAEALPLPPFSEENQQSSKYYLLTYLVRYLAAELVMWPRLAPLPREVTFSAELSSLKAAWATRRTSMRGSPPP